MVGALPKKRHKDHFKKTIKIFNLLSKNLETEAADRDGWRAARIQGTAHFEEETPGLREARRRRNEARKNQSRGEEDPSLVCSDCERRCLSCIDLNSSPDQTGDIASSTATLDYPEQVSKGCP